MPPRVFGWQHLIYLAFFFITAGASIVFFKLKIKNKRTEDIIFKCLGALLLVFIIWNRIAIAFRESDATWLIPNSFCGATSLIFAVCLLVCKRDALPLHYCVYAAFWGGLIVTIYPDFLGQVDSFMYPATISGISHHSLSAYISVLCIISGYVKPSLKKFYAFPVGFCLLMVYGLFLLDCLHVSEAMFIHDPLVDGTFLTWYVVGPALIVFSLIFAIVYDRIEKRKNDGNLADEI